MARTTRVVLVLLTAHCGLLAPDKDRDTDPPTTEGPPPPDTADTGLVLLGYAGVATIDDGLAGTETFTAVRRRDGARLCAWTWTTVDWANDPTAVGADPITLPCTDPSGQPCAFAFTVNLVDGAPDGDDEADRCAAFREVATLLPRVGPLGYGYIEDYTEVPGGLGYGPALMFYVEPPAPEPAYWVGYGMHGAFDGTTFEYDFDLGVLPY